MNSLIIKPYEGQKDWSAIFNLFQACQTVDHLTEDESLADLKLGLSSPTVNPEKDIRLWTDVKGQLLGLVGIEPQASKTGIDGYFGLYIHPSVRASNLGKQMMRWCETRIREIGQQKRCPVQLRTYSLEQQTEQNELLKQRGFNVDRQFITMAKSLESPLSIPELPSGFKLSHIHCKQDLSAWVDLFNDSFIDHWDHHELTLEQAEYWQNQPTYQPELDLVAVAPNGTFAAFCRCHLNCDQIGWIEWLGTRREFRKLGLGKTLLLAGLSQLQKAGVTTAKLSVDADSLTGATKLYQSVDFKPVTPWFSWVKPLSRQNLSQLFPQQATA
ncbi:GNAT family N-acetyltransferase [Planktothrix mougeotii]|uniref:GNAT family N-acetyltransferase n=1 Tax=Planktothrix mougeotii LEGE 06226 TaxID=1828728 RepID=A0ABR9UGB6_9CYAN|nr:GNAT family N-acetyltransferase [Planktothrix mougeotii]MBE9145144.1 GNAT family N-acetyltransferase [Planktothrix mougeotii LEGE 06226]